MNKKPIFAAVVFAILLLLGLLSPVSVSASSVPTQINVGTPSIPLADQFCQCVDYVVYKLLGGRRAPGNWPTAYSMADPSYWSQYGYYRRNGAGPGDVIIIGPSVRVIVPNEWWGDRAVDQFYPDSAGHIGIVTRADYDGRKYGWYIAMRSANWGVGGSNYSDAGCNNVNDSIIFIPNGDATSFWHRN